MSSTCDRCDGTGAWTEIDRDGTERSSYCAYCGGTGVDRVEDGGDTAPGAGQKEVGE